MHNLTPVIGGPAQGVTDINCNFVIQHHLVRYTAPAHVDLPTSNEHVEQSIYALHRIHDGRGADLYYYVPEGLNGFEVLSKFIMDSVAVKPSLWESFQDRVGEWMRTCFGDKIAADRMERNHRFFEEATELVQSFDMPREDAHKLVDYVYDRPIGKPYQEVGGVIVTLAALCNAAGLAIQACGEIELERVWSKIEKIREKQRTKPHGSPLPEHVKND